MHRQSRENRETLRSGNPAILGILGGMGPEATAEFYRRIVAFTPACRDQDHLHVLIDSDPSIPDRTSAILGQGPSPLPALHAAARRLEQAGATMLLIPCNTAHHWLPNLRRLLGVEILDMIALTADAVCSEIAAPADVGLLGTAGTVRTRHYQQALGCHGLRTLSPLDSEQAAIEHAIYSIKAGHHDQSSCISSVATSLQARGAEALVLGCTELSLLADRIRTSLRVFDPLDILARWAVALASNAPLARQGQVAAGAASLKNPAQESGSEAQQI